MNSGDTIAPHEGLSDNQRKALLKLLADEDPGVFRTVREKILAQGPGAARWLRGYRLSNDPVLRCRTGAIVRHFDKMAADDSFLAFCLNHGEDLPLEEGAWLLARTRYPEINVAGYGALLDAYAGEIRQRLTGGSGAERIIAVINSYLFHELGFSGNEQNYYDPENSYLNRVIDRRTGNPINLCTLYILICRRLQLPVSGIGLPGHFICRYQSSAAEFFVDAFNRGRILTKADCVEHLLANFSFREVYFNPVTPRRILLRICTNLRQISEQGKDAEAATRFQRYMVALSK